MPVRSTYYALDIGAYALKLLRFIPGKRPQILAAALHKNASSGPRSLEKELTEFLSREEPGTTKPIFFSLSAAQTFVRYIRLPEISESKMKRIIAFEAEQQIPFPIDEVIWDYATLSSPVLSKERITVLCAAKQDVAGEVVSTLERMRFSVEGISANPVSLYHLYHRLGFDRKKILSIDLGAQTTNVLIVSGGNFWSRGLSLGGYKLRELVQEKKGISAEEAGQEMHRIVMGGVTGEEQKELKVIAGKFFQDLLNEINQTISFYHTQAGPIKFDQAFITGGLSLIEGLAGFFESNLGVTTRRLDVDAGFFNVMDLPSGTANELPMYSVALGLAAGSEKNRPAPIRMIPGDVRTRAESVLQRWRYLAWGAVMLLILSLCVGNVYLERATKHKALDFEAARLEYYKTKEEQEIQLSQKAGQLKEKLEVVRKAISRKSLPVQIFDEIQARTPNSIWYVSFEFVSQEKDIIMLEGETYGSLSDINHFAEQLEQSPLFRAVQVVSAGIVEPAAGIEEEAKSESVSSKSAGTKAARKFSLIIEMEPGHESAGK